MSVDSRAEAHVPRPHLFVLIAMSATGPIALNIFIPSMPGLQAAFQTDYATVQLTLTCYLASLAVSQLFIGPVSDRLGRRPVFFAGMAAFIAASIACVFAADIGQLIAGRIVQATGGCAGIVLSRAIIRDVWDRDRAASMIGYVTMAMVVAPMLSPALGGVLDSWAGWQSGFWFVTVLGAVVLMLSWHYLPETNRNRTASGGLHKLAANSGALLSEPLFLGYVLNSAFGACVFFAFLAGAPFIMTDVLGRTPAEYGIFFILVSLGYMFGNFLSGRYAQRVGVNGMVAAGSCLALVGLAALVAATVWGIASPIAIFGPMTVVAVSNGLNIPSATAGAISVRPDITGTGAGLSGFFQTGLGALSTLAVGALHDGTALPMVIVMTSSGIIAFGFLLLILIKTGRGVV